MANPSVSVVVVSRDRPSALMRCLDGLAQLDYPVFEIICVTCPAGAAALAGRPDVDHIKILTFDEANISAARNIGIAHAAGDVVAFIDDDAVPEPLWLRHLTEPFGNPEVAASGGYVIGRNGISFQWRARVVDRSGQATDLDLPGTVPRVLHPEPDRAIKTEGTNMAVRRDLLADMGGFDPAFRFFLDETDLNQRLADRSLPTAIVPLAVVHHGFAESSRRRADRAPRDLFELGASTAVFLRKHSPVSRHAAAIAACIAEQKQRLLRMMQSGLLDPVDVLVLLRGLRRGLAAGATRPLDGMIPLNRAPEGLRIYPARTDRPRIYLSGRIWQHRRKMKEAIGHRQSGAIVTVVLMSPTARFHRQYFDKNGIWVQTGGLFGKSDRAMPLSRFWAFRTRVKHEIGRLIPARGH